MKIFSCDQIRQIDEYTIKNEPVASVGLMERAAFELMKWYTERYSTSQPVVIFAGPGNNGGDGLALARMLHIRGYKAKVYFTGPAGSTSPDWKINYERLMKETKVPFVSISGISDIQPLDKNAIIIDAIFGSGLSRPVKGLAAEIIKCINESGCQVIAVDIPSGLSGEDNSENKSDSVIKASYTLSFQFPKLSFLFPENECFTGKWSVLPIGLHKHIIDELVTPYRFLEPGMVKSILKKRNRFDHKGTFGHALLTGGSYGRMGAVVLGARAALRTGAGLVTCHIPSLGNLIMQCSVPEAMTIPDRSEKFISGSIDAGFCNAAGIGPGMGTLKETQEAFRQFMIGFKKPIVIDADGLNILSLNPEWKKDIPALSVLTPHPREFSRLAGESKNSFDRLKKQTEFSRMYNCIVVLKGAYTSVSDPEGLVWFNSTGNPGMATAGSGDTLTGMILSLLTQGYGALEAALTGVFIHGLAGDIAASKSSYESLIASDIIENIGDAFNRIRTE
jgi:ADP-dependent NAD(P)H-hydrate dehydratase / NAD(P)H-hydrate epimerase